jgi:phage shock protein C
MTNRLYRSRDDRMLAGVAGGLADYWDADPSLIRLIWALLVIATGGVALVVYIVMAIVVPEEGQYPMTRAEAAPEAAGQATSETQAATGVAAPPAYAVDPREARRAARAARHAERRANRGNTGPVLIGAFLIVLGAFFLVREWLPQIDFDWVWPAMLIVLGVAVLVASIRRVEGERRDEDRGSVG